MTKHKPRTAADFVFMWNELLDACDEQIDASEGVPKVRPSTTTARIVSDLAGHLQCQEVPRPRSLARVLLWQFLASLDPLAAGHERSRFLGSVADDDVVRRDETRRRKKATRVVSRLLKDLERVERRVDQLPLLDCAFDALHQSVHDVREQAEKVLNQAASPGRPRISVASGFGRRMALTLAAFPLDYATVVKLIEDASAWIPPPLLPRQRIALCRGSALRKRLDRLRAAVETVD